MRAALADIAGVPIGFFLHLWYFFCKVYWVRISQTPKAYGRYEIWPYVNDAYLLPRGDTAVWFVKPVLFSTTATATSTNQHGVHLSVEGLFVVVIQQS